MPTKNMTIYNEDWVRTKIKNHLISKGYRITYEGKGRKPGVDLKGYHPILRRYYFVEVKSEATGDSRHAIRENKFLDNLGKILLRMKQKNGKYALGFPTTYIKKIRKIPDAIRKKLKLDIFLVSETGEVTRLPYYKKA